MHFGGLLHAIVFITGYILQTVVSTCKVGCLLGKSFCFVCRSITQKADNRKACSMKDKLVES